MSPRRTRRRPDPAPPPSGPEQVESWPDGDWVIRLVPGAASAKAYLCPGCDQEIPPGMPHLVAGLALTPGLPSAGTGIGPAGSGGCSAAPGAGSADERRRRPAVTLNPIPARHQGTR